MKESALESEKYHVIRELGRGGMGVVYLAEDRLLKRQVALKVLYEHLNRESAFVARFQEEARSVSTLHHPNIVCVHGLERANDVVAIDMEYVDGQSLDRIVSEGPVSPHVAIAIARDVLSGLVICHDIGLIHRDIKPSNILIHRDGTAKLTDFGLATAYATHLENTVRGNTSSNFYMGTPRYMPVAAWEGGVPQPTWDLYSFGVVLYELLSGEVAYPGDNPMAIMKKHLTAPLPSLRSVTQGLSGELTDMVEALIRTVDQETPMLTHEFLETLRNTPEYSELKDSNSVATVAVPRNPKVRRLARSVGRVRRLPYVSIGLAGLALLAIVVYIGRGVEPPPPFSATNRASIHAIGETGVVENWLIAQGPGQETLTLTGFSETGLTRMSATAVDNDNWKISGGWAALVRPQAGSIQFGDVEGSLFWDGVDDDMHISLKRTREKDGESDTYSLVGKLIPSDKPSESFLKELEGSNLLQYLLYAELLPRTPSWPKEIEAMLPALEKGRYEIPIAFDAYQLDGKLDDPLWTKRYFRNSGGSIGDLKSSGVRSDVDLQVRWNETGVCIATRIDTPTPDMTFEITIQPDVALASAETGKFQYQIHVDDAGVLRYYQAGEEPTSLTWNGACTYSEGVASVEIEIPHDVLSATARAKDGKRWRMSATWFRERPNAGREVLARWGTEGLDEVQHGALFVFTRDVK